MSFVSTYGNASVYIGKSLLESVSNGCGPDLVVAVKEKGFFFFDVIARVSKQTLLVDRAPLKQLSGPSAGGASGIGLVVGFKL